MVDSYKKLRKLLNDKEMKKDLFVISSISSTSDIKRGKGGRVTTEVIVKICTALECTLDDIVEIVPGLSAITNDTL